MPLTSFCRVLMLTLACALLPSCALFGGSPTAPPVPNLETMDEADYNAVVTATTRIVSTGVGIALDRDAIGPSDQTRIAEVLRNVATGTLAPVDGGPISSALRDAGFTGHEIEALFLGVELTLRESGANLAALPGPRLSALLLKLAETVELARKSEGV